MNAKYDVIVLGSGIGGLSAAALLARLAGRRVLVLEQHCEIGGLTQVFTRGGYVWDVGLHYVGEMGEGALPRRLFDLITGGRLGWEKMPSPFEKFLYPDGLLEVPDDPLLYRRALSSRFPTEARALERYFRDIRRAARWHVRDMLARSLAPFTAFWLRLLNLPGRRFALQTTASYLERHFRDVRLKALLATQWGNYGLPPEQSALAIHALIVNHYLQGGWFPRGGSASIARAIEPVIERSGGRILHSQEVRQILVKEGKAVGVQVIDRRGASPREVRYLAPLVISAVGAQTTFSRLLDGPEASRIRRETERLPPGASAVSLYLGLKESPETLGIRGENYWINERYDHGDLEGQTRELLSGAPVSCYLSFPSLKGGEPSARPTAEIIAQVDPAAFAAWADQPWGRRSPEYYLLKERIAEGLLALVERHLPGFGGLVAFRELSTPLTMVHFTGRSHGAMYGLAATPARYRLRWLGVRTPIRNLYLAGSDVSSCGIVGALMGGAAAAGRLLGPGGFFRIIAEATRASFRPEGAAPDFIPTGDLLSAVLEEKRQITDTVYELAYRLPEEVDFVPGQYVRIQVGEREWRAYSIVGIRDHRLTLLVDTRSGGTGSRYIRALRQGETSRMRLPSGGFRLMVNPRRKIFVATGTGITPFLPMFDQLAEAGYDQPVELVFGCRTHLDNFLPRYLQAYQGRLDIRQTVCFSREPVEGNGVRARVTVPLGELSVGAESDVYVSGNPNMVADVLALLRRRGLSSIFSEPY